VSLQGPCQVRVPSPNLCKREATVNGDWYHWTALRQVRDIVDSRLAGPAEPGVQHSMSGDEDDYLSDKFLATLSANPSAPKSYSQLRKEADRKAKLKNEQNRTKSRRQREVEAREEGLSKSLFERANEEQGAGIVSGNKALSMMMKMGFKPGQSLGRVEDVATPPSDKLEGTDADLHSGHTAGANTHTKQITEPIPLNEWAGQSGVRPWRSKSDDSSREEGYWTRQAREVPHCCRKSGEDGKDD